MQHANIIFQVGNTDSRTRSRSNVQVQQKVTTAAAEDEGMNKGKGRAMQRSLKAYCSHQSPHKNPQE
jgi:hypothetical protein